MPQFRSVHMWKTFVRERQMPGLVLVTSGICPTPPYFLLLAITSFVLPFSPVLAVEPRRLGANSATIRSDAPRNCR